MPLTSVAAAQRIQPAVLEALAFASAAAAKHLGVEVAGVPEGLAPAAAAAATAAADGSVHAAEPAVLQS